MRLLITTDTIGGVWTYTRELAEGLLRRGTKVTLVSFGEIPTLEQTAWMDAFPGLDFRPTGFRLEWMQDCEDDLAASAEYLRTVIDEVEPDLLHLNQYCYGSLDCEQPRVVVAHSDVIGWWNAVHRAEPKDSSWIRQYRRTVSCGLHAATAVVAPTQWMMSSLTANYLEPAQTRVIPNGRAPSRFLPYLKKEDYALSVGRVWDFGKNAGLLARIDPPMQVYVVGDNRSPERRTEPSVLQGASQRLVFQGVLDQDSLRHLYSRASIYIATSQYEPFGLAPLEAALSRCALLVSDIPSFREVWGDAAWYFENNDPASLEREFERLAGDPGLCASMGKLAFEHALEHYSAAGMVERYSHLYRNLTRAGVLAA